MSDEFDAPDAAGSEPNLSPSSSPSTGATGSEATKTLGKTVSGDPAAVAKKLIPGSIADQIAKSQAPKAPGEKNSTLGSGIAVGSAAAQGAAGATKASKAVGGGVQGALVQGGLELLKKENRNKIWLIFLFSSPISLFLVGTLIITLGMGMMSFTSQNNNSGMAGQSADAAKISGLSDSDYEYIVDGAKRNDVPWQVLASILAFEKNQPKSKQCAPSGSDASVSDMDSASMAGQHVLVGAQPGSDAATKKAVTDSKLGGVFLLGNWSSAAAIKAFATGIPKSNGINPTISGDREGGQIQMNKGGAPQGWTDVPSAVEQGKMSASELASKWTKWAKELKDAGMTTDFGPVADAVKDASNSGAIGKYDRQYGSDPSKIAPLVGAVSKGMSDSGIEAVTKHFPGLGNIAGNTDTTGDKSAITDSTTTDSDLDAFKSAIDNQANVMVSTAYYTKIDPNNQAIFSSKVITDILRKKLSFNGVVYSDEIGSAKAASNVSVADRAVKMIEAGGDVALASTPADAAAMVKGITDKANKDADFKKKLSESTSRVVSAKNNYDSGAASAGAADNGDCSSSPGDTGSTATDAGSSNGSIDTSKYTVDNVKGTEDSIEEAKKSGDRWRLLMEVARYARNAGWSLSENPHVATKAVTVNGHTMGSLHYYGQAIDLNVGGPGDNDPVEVAHANKLLPILKKSTIGWLWQAPGHLNHVHIDTGAWYMYNPSNPMGAIRQNDCAKGQVPEIYGKVTAWSPNNKIHFFNAPGCSGTDAGSSSASTPAAGDSTGMSSDDASAAACESGDSSSDSGDSNVDGGTGIGKGDVVNDTGKYKMQWVKKGLQKVAYEMGDKYHLKTVGGWRDPKVEKIEPGGHPAGNSADFMINDIPNGVDVGNKLKQDLIDQSKAGKIKVREIIFQQHIWTPQSNKWTLMEDRGSPTANHMDHVHLSLDGDKTPIGGDGKDYNAANPAANPTDSDSSDSSSECADNEHYITVWNIPESEVDDKEKKALLASSSHALDWVAQRLRAEMNKPENRDYYDMRTGETHAEGNHGALYVDPTKDNAALVAKAWQKAIESTKLKDIDSSSSPTIYNVALQWFLGNKASFPVAQDETSAASGAVQCTVDGNGATIAGAHYSKQQLSNAALLVKAGEDAKVPDKAIDVMLAAALGESTMQRLAAHEVPESVNYPHDGFDPSGVGSSGYYHAIGILQQRVPNYGWGTVAQAMDPYHAGQAFLGVAKDASAPGLKQKSNNFAGIDKIDLGVLVNMVQVAAVPGGSNYGQVVALYNHQGEIGKAMHKIVKGANCSSSAGGTGGSYSGPVGDPGQYKDFKVPDGGCTKCVEMALKMVGMPYIYGGGDFNGPTGHYSEGKLLSQFKGKPGFDCSGLTMFAYHQAGAADLDHLASNQRHRVSSNSGGLIYDANKLKPGMLVFNHADSSGGAGHVGIYMGNGLVVEAPNPDATVHVIKISDFMKYNGTWGGGGFPTGYKA